LRPAVPRSDDIIVPLPVTTVQWSRRGASTAAAPSRLGCRSPVLAHTPRGWPV